MRIAILSIAMALVVIGASGKLAYDARRDAESRQRLEEQSSGVTCSVCAAHKADLQRLREYKVQRSRAEEPADPNAE